MGLWVGGVTADRLRHKTLKNICPCDAMDSCIPLDFNHTEFLSFIFFHSCYLVHSLTLISDKQQQVADVKTIFCKNIQIFQSLLKSS